MRGSRLPCAGPGAGIAGALRALAGGLVLVVAASLRAEEPPDFDMATLFNWDLVSLEQNNPRFNASVLSGFHSVRSPGVTPYRAWKTGLGVLYTREEKVAEASNTQIFSTEQVIFNPKINHGFLTDLEAGAGLETVWTSGETVEQSGDIVETFPEEAWALSAVDLGIKWGFLKLGRLRLGASFDTRIAVSDETFGALPDTTYNVEVDGDLAITQRFGLLSNLQLMTTANLFDPYQVIFDLGASYAFSDKFRGMIFGNLQGGSEADNVLIFGGIAGQYVFEQHSFTVALDLQLNEADREVRTQKQLDVEFSYTFTF